MTSNRNSGFSLAFAVQVESVCRYRVSVSVFSFFVLMFLQLRHNSALMEAPSCFCLLPRRLCMLHFLLARRGKVYSVPDQSASNLVRSFAAKKNKLARDRCYEYVEIFSLFQP